MLTQTKFIAVCFLATASAALKCDAQNSNFINCPGTYSTQPCANSYKDTMASTGCGAPYQYPCYQCCVDDTDPGCASGWANCGFNEIGGTCICPDSPIVGGTVTEKAA